MQLLIIDATYQTLALGGVLLALNAVGAIWIGNKAVRRAGADVQLPDAFAAVQRVGFTVVAGALLATAAQFMASALDLGNTTATVLFVVCTVGLPLPALVETWRQLSRAVATSAASSG